MPLPPDKMHRVIINTDAKNEADDQYAIVHALLTPSFDLHGILTDRMLEHVESSLVGHDAPPAHRPARESAGTPRGQLPV